MQTDKASSSATPESATPASAGGIATPDDLRMIAGWMGAQNGTGLDVRLLRLAARLEGDSSLNEAIEELLLAYGEYNRAVSADIGHDYSEVQRASDRLRSLFALRGAPPKEPRPSPFGTCECCGAEHLCNCECKSGAPREEAPASREGQRFYDVPSSLVQTLRDAACALMEPRADVPLSNHLTEYADCIEQGNPMPAPISPTPYERGVE